MHEKVKGGQVHTACQYSPYPRITETSEHSVLRMSALPCCSKRGNGAVGLPSQTKISPRGYKLSVDPIFAPYASNEQRAALELRALRAVPVNAAAPPPAGALQASE